MGKIIKKDFLSFIIILVVFLLDQASKYYVVNFFNDQYYEIFLTSFLNIQLIWNEGIAFGLLSFENRYYYNLISLIIFIVILILVFLMKSQEKFKYFYAMIIGGAIGNLIDRIRYSAVPDFIDFHINDFHWFVFNIADIFVSLGVFCLIIAEIFFNKNNLNEKI